MGLPKDSLYTCSYTDLNIYTACRVGGGSPSHESTTIPSLLLQCMAYIDNLSHRGTIMAPTKIAKITVVQHPEDIWMAMLDLLPVDVWNELFREVAKTHYWRY